MSESQILFRALAQKMAFERNQGLDYEAHHRLPPGWRLEERADGYVFVGVWSEDWENVVWRLVRFLSYKSVIALYRSGVGKIREYELVTCTEDGRGFRAVFRSLPGPLEVLEDDAP